VSRGRRNVKAEQQAAAGEAARGAGVHALEKVAVVAR